MPEQDHNDQPGDLKPRPDPSSLTTQQLHEAIANLRELLESRMAASEALTDEKFSAAKEANCEQKERINRLDRSLTTLESRDEVRMAAANSKQSSLNFVVSCIAVLISFAGLATFLFISFRR